MDEDGGFMNSIVKKWGFNACLVGLLLPAATSLYGLGLGDMDLESRLNQPFSANIPVMVPAETEASEISVKLAEVRQFKRAGLKRGGPISQLQFSPERRADGQMVIEIKSAVRMTEPMLSFVLQVEQGGTRSLRKYTVMLEAPGM